MKNKKLVDAIGNIKDEYINEAHKTDKGFTLHISKGLIFKVLAAAACLLLVINIFPILFKSAKSADSAQYNYSSESAYASESMINNSGAYSDEGEPSEYSIADSLKNTDKKLILTSHLNMETTDIDTVIEKLINSVNKYNGYVQNASLSTKNTPRYYEATIRIPADQYTSFLNDIQENGNTIAYSEEVEDITDSYTDLTARLNSLKTQREKVLEFYDKAETIEELMSIENRISELQYQIEYYEAQIKNYDLLVAYSTLHIRITETKTYTPVNDGFFTSLARSFINGFHEFINNIGDFIIDIAYNIFTIIALILFVYIAYLIYKAIKKRINK